MVGQTPTDTAPTAQQRIPNRRVLDGIHRAWDLLIEHSDVPSVNVSIMAHGLVRLHVTAIHTVDEETRRQAVDRLAAAVGIGPASFDGAGHYLAISDTWQIETTARGGRCPNCGRPI